MRYATIFFVMMLCSTIAFGQGQPQWTVIQHVELSQQGHSIPQTTILVPTEPGIYRISVYFSVGGGTGSGAWLEVLDGTDITGAPLEGYGTLELPCAAASWFSAPPFTVSLKPQEPLTYQVKASTGAAGCQYNLAIIVEQLL